MTDTVFHCQRNCGAACGTFCAFLAIPFVRPLTGFWFLCVGLGIPTLVIGVQSALDSSSNACDQGKTLAWIQVALGAIHIIYVHYMQHRLAKNVLENNAEGAESPDLAHTAMEVVLYDPVFCLYTPTWIASFCIGIWGLTSDSVACINKSPSWLLIVFGVLSAMYGCVWGAAVSVCGLAKSAFGKSRVDPSGREVPLARP